MDLILSVSGICCIPRLKEISKRIAATVVSEKLIVCMVSSRIKIAKPKPNIERTSHAIVAYLNIL